MSEVTKSVVKAQKKTDAKSKETVLDEMKVFNDRSFKKLLLAVKDLKDPIDLNCPLTNEVSKFFSYAVLILPTVRDRSTGRQHILHSEEADHLFGITLVQVMSTLLHKFTIEMTGTLNFLMH